MDAIEKVEREARRMDAVRLGQIRRQKEILKRLLRTGEFVTVSRDKPMRYAAAESLVETGFAKVLRKGMKRVRSGPMPASGLRRQRMEMTLIAVEELVSI